MAPKHAITDEAGDPPAAKRQATENVPEPDAPLIEMAPRGDVIFVLDGGKMKLKVSSTVMSLASPAFNAMFSPDRPWTEAQDLSEHHPKEVPLCDDDPEAMKLICEFLHHQHDPDKNVVPTQQVFKQVALLAHKYLLQSSLRCYSERWLKAHIKRARVTGYEYHHDLLAIAHLLDSPELFTLISKDFVVFLYSPSQQTGTMHKVLSSKVLLELDRTRHLLKERMNDTIHRAITGWLTEQTTFGRFCLYGAYVSRKELS
ncbi:hypothetical protein SLS55_000128 [Diplodia seriata]|uniref:BTB domain-containing protein n=1 Tax=Diplodia seriata TaxID=420778 RepID=A0ABR3CTG0_9PEZI